MDAFPFTKSEWGQVAEASWSVTNASLANDEVLRASCFLKLKHLLNELRVRYGDHPVLLETEADFTEDLCEQVSLYESALCLAVAKKLPTLSIRISYAEVLLASDRAVVALSELMACRDELVSADKDEQNKWYELFAKAK